jgi:hypothetical protein
LSFILVLPVFPAHLSFAEGNQSVFIRVIRGHLLSKTAICEANPFVCFSCLFVAPAFAAGKPFMAKQKIPANGRDS